MPVKEKNYWLETVTTPAVESAQELPDSTDVAVVGGATVAFPLRGHSRNAA